MGFVIALFCGVFGACIGLGYLCAWVHVEYNELAAVIVAGGGILTLAAGTFWYATTQLGLVLG